MNELVRKSIAVFARPFSLPGLDETLPAGEYDIETELCSPPDCLHPEAWKASVAVRLHSRASHPGLARTLTVSLADLDDALAKDKLTGKDLAEIFLEEMLADPMVRLVMEADGVSELQLRHLYSGGRATQTDKDAPGAAPAAKLPKDISAIQAAENEGMPTQGE
ncbi:hypothetical protein [Ruegeria arenilitoris]|uniref:Uncharacterized protein n=1 Tax=Ruegeria arenilitoris TaxID=1173585 RepID=A0A238KG72_9RHOB|nr:hypothetical protein [Ruegeria arenilitoris]SMX41016.1 hypothetical protein RUA8715_01864 [Ruegeria arenilitoris]